MAKLFLRSGSLDDFLALGENGQPVYASALQLRETLRLRKQQQIADCLAIPQPNENGDRIDWYSPVEGKITSWIAASEEERNVALKRLENYQATVAEISQRAQNAEKAGQKLFGVLLAKAIQFPGPNHVYLVDGNPVLTFWGFVNLDKKSRTDALDCLRPAEKESEPLFTVPTSAYAQPPAAPAVAPAPKPVVTPEPVPAPQPAVAVRSPWMRMWWLLPAAALATVLTLQIRGCVSEQSAASETDRLASASTPQKRVLPSSAPQPPVNNAPAPAETTPAEPVVEKAPPAETAPPETTIAAPVAETPAVKPPAASEPKDIAAPPAPLPEPAPPVVPAGKDDLVMPADAVRIGSIKFLNGTWRVAVDAKTPPITGRPPSLRYQIKDGRGTARITHGDGVTCRANIEAGLMSSGNLIINSRSRARCSDNSRFQMPEIVCKQSAAGAAECIGRYNADSVFPMTVTRESKS
ncbi:SrfA family protein [Brenneria izbisi]|uniref:SrfA family protein n=1 Tax=Brenneria izbisi TaxID=2939450 RepID=A0AA41XV51_9GAMM|nr:SrfA family protein [Brenneria izbisi]MCV9877423.1 SrfA family protein [Brenneria izbisi]MCV9881011.1 SrfA family protein [Brenneria izbisi]